MINRRDLITGLACVATAGAGYALVPRRRLSLLGDRSLDQMIPRSLPDWTSSDTTDLVSPTEPGSLASRLYQQTLGRIYRRSSSGDQVMLLMAYGDTQSDDLMVHRPETCYPAFGFALSDNVATPLPLPGSVTLPARRFIAHAGGRSESILYWIRLGEFLPTDKKQQQFDRVQTAFQGFIADGILVRFSARGADPLAGLDQARQLATALVTAVLPTDRAGLIGSDRARALIRAGV